MGWRDLLETPDDAVLTTAYVGAYREIQHGAQAWVIEGKLPPEEGWYTFALRGRTARWTGEPVVAPYPIVLKWRVKGFLAGDRLIPDATSANTDPRRAALGWARVHLLEALPRFARVEAGRLYEHGPLVFVGEDFPLGPEPDVQRAFEDGLRTLVGVPGVTPALDAAFAAEVWRRDEAAARRAAAEKARREEEERREAAERRDALVKQLGDAAGRREMAKVDFDQAAKAALAVGGAELLDHRVVRRGKVNDHVIRFRFERQRFECVCDDNLRIVDAGICLIDHRNETKGDTRFTLESLPAVIREAQRGGKLVVFRHAE